MNSDAIRFVPVRPDNEAALLRLLQALESEGEAKHFHPHPFTEDAVREIARHSGKDEYLLAFRSGEPVAYGMLRGWDEGFEIPSLGIACHPAHRGRGIGRHLTQELHRRARKAGADQIRLKVYPDNARAIALYRDLGYRFEAGLEHDQLVGYAELKGSVFASTTCLPGREPLANRLDAYLAAGLNRVELGAGVDPEPDWIDIAREGTERLLLHNYFPPPAESFVLNLASADSGVRERSTALARDAIGFCRELDIPFYSVHAGFITEPTGFGTTSFEFPAPTSEESAERAMERFETEVVELTAYAHRNDVSLLIENNVCPVDLKGKLLLQTTREGVEFFGHPRISARLLLDTGHLNVSARTFEFSPMEFVDRLAPHIRAIHLHGNSGLADEHLPVTEGGWEMDLLRRDEFAEVPVVVESKYSEADALAAHIEWLRHELDRN